MAQTAALGAPLGVEGLAVPLYEHDGHCTDPRFPRLAGPWLLSCARGGQVTHATDLRSGRSYALPRPLDAPGVGPAAVYAAGRDGGLFRLQEAGVEAETNLTVVHGALAAPPATDGVHIAVLVGDQVQAFEATSRSRRSWPSGARGWYPPALRWPVVAWVAEGADGDEDVLWIDLSGSEGPQPLAAGPGHQRHVVASSTHIAWVDDDAVVVLDPDTGLRQRHPARTGFLGPPSLWGEVACWEERQRDIDIRCSDGLRIDGPGHQHHPSRHERWLLYREDDRLMLFSAASP